MKAWLTARRSGQLILACLILSYWVCAELIFPVPFYSQYDPEMQYMLSSLGPFKGQNYVYVDHPGTPVELVGSVLFVLTYPAAWFQHQPFVSFQIDHPSVFLTIARLFLTLMSALCAVLLFRWTFVGTSWFDLASAISVALLFFAVHPLGFLSLVLWSHNSFAFPFGTLLLLFLVAVVRTRPPFPWQRVWLLGFCIGVLTAVQLYFATWIIGASLTLMSLAILEQRGWRQAVQVGVTILFTSVLGFFLSTLPILSLYGQFFAWVTELVVHQDRYGSGPTGITSVESLSSHASQLWGSLPTLFIATGLLLAAVGILLVVRRHSVRQNAGTWAIAIGLSVQLVITFGLVLKHPAEKYMLGVAAILPILLAMVMSLIDSPRLPFRLLKLSICILVAIGFGANFLGAVDAQQTQQRYLNVMAQDIQRHVTAFANSVGKTADATVVLWTYGVPSPCYARLFGDDYANRAFGSEIQPLCGNQLQRNIWDTAIYNGLGPVRDKDLHWDIMVVDPVVFSTPPNAYLAKYGEMEIGDSGLIFIKSNK